MNISGSISGDEIQNAITGAKGTPALNNPAMSETTPQEQKGESPSKNPAAIIAVAGCPWKTHAI